MVIYAENRAVDSVKGVGYSEYEKERAAFRIWLRFGKSGREGGFSAGLQETRSCALAKKQTAQAVNKKIGGNYG